MVYLTWIEPQPRSGDTPIGKIIGYLQAAHLYMNLEGWAGAIDLIMPNWFPINIVQDALISIVKAIYKANVQGAYDGGADRGNQMNNEILGWVQDLRTQAQNQIDQINAIINKAQDLLSSHEKRLKQLERQTGLPIQMPELYGKLP
jgi:hypothetical protein